MLSTRRHGASILTVKEVLENGFVAGSSGHIHSSPIQSYYLDFDSTSKLDSWELLLDVDNTTKGSSLCAVKQPEPLSSCVKSDLHSLTQGMSDLSQATFDLSSWPGEHSSRAGPFLSIALQNTSTPCKTEKQPKLQESLLSRSTELMADLSTLGKAPAAPRWEISAIKDPLDTSLSLEVSNEELPGCSRSDPPPPLEPSVVVSLAWPGAFKRQAMLLHRSATFETQPSQPDPLPLSASTCASLLPWDMVGCELPPRGPSAAQRSGGAELPPTHAGARKVQPCCPALGQGLLRLPSWADDRAQRLGAGGSGC